MSKRSKLIQNPVPTGPKSKGKGLSDYDFDGSFDLPNLPSSSTPPSSNDTPVPFTGKDISKGTGTADQFLTQLGFEPQPNPMSEVFQPSYHFKLYLKNDLAPDDDHFIIIAETGLTTMNIQDVRIESFIGPNIRSKNANATSITIKIYEPLGSMLPDLLYQAAVDMKIFNYLKAPWTLDLTLHGYDENGKPKQIGEKWSWQLIMIDMQSQITESGTVHTINAMPLAEVALNNQYCILPVGVQVQGQTVGEILQNLMKSLNDDSKSRYGGPPLVLEYAVDQEKYPRDNKVGVNAPFDHKVILDQPQQNNERSNNERGVVTGQFSAGTDIPSIVDAIMSKSPTATKQVRISRNLDTDKNGVDAETEVVDITSVMHRVDTKVELVNYDPILGDYMKKITYTVRPYDSLRLLTSIGRAINFDKDDKVNLQKAQAATLRSYLVKQYDYIFTGLNTEIEKFDISLNFRWAVSVPLAQGTSHYGTSTIPAEVTDSSAARFDAAKLQSLNNQRDQLRTEFNAKYPPPDPNLPPPDPNDPKTKAKDAEKAADQQKLNDLDSQISTIQSKLTTSRAAALAKQDATIKQIRKSLPPANTLIEDEVTERVQKGTVNGNAPSYLPITINQDGDDPAVLTGLFTSTDATNGRSIYGTLLNQLYGSFDGNLQNITLDIKGDPYWLGPGNDNSIYTTPSSIEKPNFMNGEHMFVFRFKLPQGYDDSTGTVSIATENKGSDPKAQSQLGLGNTNIITGFYACISVTNIFSQGIFKQILNATRIQGWTYENLIEGKLDDSDRRNLVVDPTAPSGPDGNTPGKATGRPVNPSGTTRGNRNNNPGNLRDGSFAKNQPGYAGSDGTFAKFDTYEHGVAAQETLLRNNYLQKPTTVTNVIDRYLGKNVPGNINSSASRNNYIASVTQTLGKSNVDSNDTSRLAEAMRKFESGARGR